MMGAGPHIFSLSPEDRRAVYDEALERVRVASMEAAAEHKKAAAYCDPRADCYLTWKGNRTFCVLVVKHRTCPGSFDVSRDGISKRSLYLPFSVIKDPLPGRSDFSESTEDFLLAMVPFTWMERIEQKDFVGAQPLRELFGITLPLSDAREWTDEQIETWTRLSRTRENINWRIQTARLPSRHRQSIGTRNHFA